MENPNARQPTVTTYGDASFVHAWPTMASAKPHQPLYEYDNYPPKPTPTYEPFVLGEFLKRLEAKITTPLAFGAIAYYGDGGFGYTTVSKDFDPIAMAKLGWLCVAWKPTIHEYNKYPVRLFMRELKDREWPKVSTTEQPEADFKRSHGVCGCQGMASFGCSCQQFSLGPKLLGSTFAAEYAATRDYDGHTADRPVNFLRAQRPLSRTLIAKLREMTFRLVATTPFNQYWVRGEEI